MNKISVIIPTRNREKCLKKTIESILNQTFSHEDYEIIVVDNGSTDNTKDMVQKLQSIYEKEIRYFYENNPGLHQGRHRGAKESNSEILVFTDDDVTADKMWLESIYTSFSDKEVVLIGGKILPQWEISPPIWIEYFWKECEYGKCLGYLSLIDFGNEIKTISGSYVWGCNFSIRKNILYASGGFHPDSMPADLIRYRGDGESALAREIEKRGYKIIYNPKALLYHFIPKERMTVEYFCKRAFNQGISDSYTKIRKEYLEGIKDDFKIKNFMLDIIKTNIKYFLYRLKKRDIETIRMLILKSWHKGVLFHRKCIKKDKELLKYVIKKDYFEEITDEK